MSGQCEDMIAADERASGRAFDAVLRLRPDLFWETRMQLPSPLLANTVYTPNMDSQNGVNDHLAVGERKAMAKYMTRIRHANRSDVRVALKALGSEGYLRASLAWDGLAVRRLQEWMYCPHTPRNLLLGSASKGCIGRVRCRLACTSLWCPSASIKAGECSCLNETCSVFVSATGAAPGGKTAVLGPGGLSEAARRIGLKEFRKPSDARRKRDWLRWCVDVRAGSQPGTACRGSHSTQISHALSAHTVRAHSHFDNVLLCVHHLWRA